MARIIVGNIPSTLRERELDDIFYKFGRIESIEIRGARINESSRRRTAYAYVQFRDWQDAADAAKSRNGYEIDGQPITVEVDEEYRDDPRGGSFRGKGKGRPNDFGYGKGGGGASPTAAFNRYYDSAGVSEKYFRVVVTNLPRGASWQDLKDKMRDAGECRFTEVTRDGVGVAGFAGQPDVERAVRTLDDTEMKSHFGDTSIIRVEEFSDEKHGETLGHIGKVMADGPAKVVVDGVVKEDMVDGEEREAMGTGVLEEEEEALPKAEDRMMILMADPLVDVILDVDLQAMVNTILKRAAVALGDVGREEAHGVTVTALVSMETEALREAVLALETEVLQSVTSSTTVDHQVLDKWGTAAGEYSDALVAAGGHMPSYDVKVIKQRLNTITALLDTMQSNRRKAKRFTFRQRPVPDNQWSEATATQSASTTRPSTATPTPASAGNVLSSLNGGVYDIDVNSSCEVYNIQDVSNCTIRFNSSGESAYVPAAIYVHNMRQCFLSVDYKACPSMQGVGGGRPVILCYNCHDSVIQLSGGCVARQLRVHASDGLVIYADANATPIIEECTRIAVGHSFGSIPTTPSITVADFSYLQTQGVSPNWRPIPDHIAFRRAQWGDAPLQEIAHLFE
ncbi:Serine/arginine-rich splicing factor 1 [Perkinsus chesapeaki]|uniref:Serine/arginine-rich splicing factor 1 n=1 Tax=Perkinsus chesapeaki TaxID=330153 RepID=A0A7J6LQN6_PERCH|nr:Serine/arginine-rich splicing factor 1 [Perkinsus chesapeaki]